MRSATSTRSRPVWLCSLQERTSALTFFRACLLIAGLNELNCLPLLARAPRWRNVNPRNVNSVCSSYEHTEFTFLGFTFRQRGARAKSGRQFNSFNPAISRQALKKVSAEVRSWRLHNHTGLDLVEVAERINPIVRGWMNYYGAFYRSAMYPLLQRINAYLVR